MDAYMLTPMQVIEAAFQSSREERRVPLSDFE